MQYFIKLLAGVSLASAMVLLSGCGEDDSAVETQMLVQQYIDTGDYSAAIALLTAKETLDDSDRMLLAAAYMGESGFSFSEVLKAIVRSSDTNDSAYVAFLQEVQTTVQNDSSALEKMDAALEQLNAISEESNQVSLNKGTVLTMKATSVLTIVADVEGFDGEDPLAQDDLIATGCALDFVADDELSSDSKCDSVEKSPITLDGVDYTLLRINVIGSEYNNFYKLANKTGDDVVFTSGVCTDNNYAEDPNCIAMEGSVYVPTPQLDGNTTLQTALLDTLNDGFDAIIDSAPDDVKEDIDEYKNEMDTNGDGVISDEELAQYIQDNAQ